jgi:hypothetical protein
MRRVTLAVALTVAVAAQGCFTVKVNAPQGTTVVLADQAPSSKSTSEKKHIYLFNGLLPVNNNTTADLVPSDCKRVGITTEMTAVDGLITVGLALVNGLVFGALAATGSMDPAVANLAGTAVNLTILPHFRTSKAYCYERGSSVGY